MFVVSLVLMVFIGRSWATWGFTSPRRWVTSTVVPIVLGGLFGALSSATILFFNLPPMEGVRELGLLKIVLVVWFGSTIAEEIFVRGLMQGWMQPVDGVGLVDGAIPAADGNLRE